MRVSPSYMSRFERGSPENTLLRWIDAWASGNFQLVARLSQVHWRKFVVRRPARYLKHHLGSLRPQGVEVLAVHEQESSNTEQPGIYMVSVAVRMKLSLKGPEGWGEPVENQWRFNLIKEGAHGFPDPDGTWGVNPASFRPYDPKEYAIEVDQSNEVPV